MTERPSSRKGGRTPTPSAELKRRLSTARETHLEAIDALRDAVCAYLDDLRAAGLPRERALEAVKSFIAESQAPRAAQDGRGEIDERLVVRLTAWCVDHWDSR